MSDLAEVVIYTSRDDSGLERVVGVLIDGVRVRGTRKVTVADGIGPPAVVTVELIAKNVRRAPSPEDDDR